MYQVHITMTAKSYGSREGYSIFGEETHPFGTLADAKAFLTARYGTCKRVPILRDLPTLLEGTAYKSGFIGCFHNADWSHAPVDRWLQRDWCEIFKVTPVNLQSTELAA